MRSLTIRLTLAFLAVSLVGAVLAALFARWTTSRQFDQFVLDQSRADFVTQVTAITRRMDRGTAFALRCINHPLCRLKSPATRNKKDSKTMVGRSRKRRRSSRWQMTAIA